ncbi:MAG: segregation/condensation protein A [Candidatus Liptonbacteria bacterium]|nr:segregation/condensation protein A [Candidatus Liptonbacteria bacterium]
MNPTYELRLEKFAGPLDKLLQFIEERKMEVSEISLAAVTDDFLKYIRSLEKVEVPTLADFIVVASRLVLLKSKSLLPRLELSQEEEEDIKDLERRLKLYRELKPAMKMLQLRWREKNNEFSRPYFLEGGLGAAGAGSWAGVFYPGDKLNQKILLQALSNIVEGFRDLEVEEKVVRERVVSIEEKIQEIILRLQGKGEDSFMQMAESKTKAEIIIIFLAILHLAREQLIYLEQETYFSDIIVRRK